MNMTVLLALVAALAAIFMLKRILTYLLMRRAGRQALAEVGKRALTKLPEYVSLSRVESPDWTNEELVRQQAQQNAGRIDPHDVPASVGRNGPHLRSSQIR